MVTQADVNRIHERLDDIAKIVNGIAAACPLCQEDVRRLKRDVYGGNGKPGMLGDVAGLKQVEQKSFTRRERWLGLVAALIIMLVGVLASWLTGQTIKPPELLKNRPAESQASEFTNRLKG